MVGIFWMRIEKKEVTQAALARFTRMTTMNVSKIVSRLEKR
jgi:DNA-binding MarR family transcriptional regulator